MSRTTFVIFSLLLCFVFACGGPPQGSGSGQSGAGGSGGTELTDDLIKQGINGERVWDVPPETGTGEPISWGFDEDEPKEITIIDKQLEGNRATVIMDIKTQSHPRSSKPRYVYGQFKTEWEIETGWVLRRWEIERTENISLKYKDLPKPSPTPTQANANSNR